MFTKLLLAMAIPALILSIPVGIILILGITSFVLTIIMIFNPKVYNNFFGPINDCSQ